MFNFGFDQFCGRSIVRVVSRKPERGESAEEEREYRAACGLAEERGQHEGPEDVDAQEEGPHRVRDDEAASECAERGPDRPLEDQTIERIELAVCRPNNHQSSNNHQIR